MNIKTIYEELDKQKFDAMNKGYAYDMVMIDRQGVPYHSGIGDGEQMTLMCLISLCDLFRSAGECDIEEFAESVKQSLIHFNNEAYDGFIEQAPKS